MRWRLLVPLGCFGFACVAACSPVGDACKNAVDISLLRVRVDPTLAWGIVTTRGACDAASCLRQTSDGCVEWRSKMTGGPGTNCAVTLTEPSGRTDVADVKGQFSCGPVGADVFFETGGPVVSQYPPSDAGLE